MIVLDASVVNLALPAMSSALSLSAEDLSWVVNAYILVFGGFLLVGGRVVDHVGPREAFLGGVGLFTVASFAGGLAQSAAWLVAARAVQGLAAAVLAPATLAILTRLYAQGAPRNRAIAVWGAVSVAGVPIGGLVGGLLTGSLGWSSVLLVNVPLGVIAVIAARRAVPPLPVVQGRRIDVPGALSVTAGASLLVYVLVNANVVGWATIDTVAPLLVAVCLLGGFVAIERRTRNPLVPRGLLRASGLPATCAVGVLGGVQFYGIAFYVTLYLQHVLGYTPLEAGVAYVPYGAAAIATTRAAAPLVTWMGFRRALIAGFAVTALGLAALTGVDPNGGYFADVLPGLLLMALGCSVVGVATNVAALNGIATSSAGLAAGLVTAAQEIGGAFGLAVLVAAYSVASGGADVATGNRGDVFQGLRTAYGLGAVMALAGAVVAATLLPERADRKRVGRTDSASAP